MSLTGWDRREDYFRINYPELSANQPSPLSLADVSWGTRQVLTGAIESRRHWLALLAEAADSPRWGDYALYDCAACHHELRTDSLRQRRGYPGVPGRPRQAEWPEGLFDVAIAYAKDDGTNEAFQDQLNRAFSDRPFGNPQDVRAAARAGMVELDRLQAQVLKDQLDAETVRSTLRSYLQRLESGAERGSQPTGYEYDLLDYETARSIIWAIQQLSAELCRLGTPLSDSAVALIARLGSEPVGELVTKLPAGQDRFIYREFAAAEMRRRADYTPEALAQQLSTLRQLLFDEN